MVPTKHNTPHGPRCQLNITHLTGHELASFPQLADQPLLNSDRHECKAQAEQVRAVLMCGVSIPSDLSLCSKLDIKPLKERTVYPAFRDVDNVPPHQTEMR